jgi:oleate hydratase
MEETGEIGGSLDASGSPADGYSMRGGRMFESKYLCTFDLFASIPTLDETQTVTQEIFAWNETMKTASKSRLVRDGYRQTAPKFGLSEDHILTIERLALEPEAMLGKTSIADQFGEAFFETDFWLMWCTTFAFQPWHSAVEFKRYLVRFAHMVEGFNRLHGIMRTVYNQYDSLVRPLRKWLDERGVVFETDTRVTHIGFCGDEGARTVDRITYQRGGVGGDFAVKPSDRVLVTLGSMTEGSSLGSMDRARRSRTRPTAAPGRSGSAWLRDASNLAIRRCLTITSSNLSGCRSPPRCTIRPSCAWCGISPAMRQGRGG